MMVRTPRSAVVTAAVAAVLAALAAAAAAHEGEEHGVLDLDALAARVQDQATSAPTVRVRAAYARLGRALGRDSQGRLSRDVAKVRAAAQSVAGPLFADGALYGLVAEASDAADDALARLPDAVETAGHPLARDGDRARLARTVVAAFGLHRRGRDVRSVEDERKALALYLRAAKKYEQALALAERLARRAGGTRPTRVAAAPGRVYTVAGTGEGGFNGDGRDARRTSLYFVDECRFGPDGLLYLLDWNNHSIRCIDPDGTVRRICGAVTPGDSEGVPEESRFNHPSAVAFGDDGVIYVAAWHNHKVKVYDPRPPLGPRVYTIAGGPQGSGGDGEVATDARFALVPGICRLPDGDLLVTDAGNQVIRRISLSSAVTATNVAGVDVQTGVVSHFAGTTGVSGRDGDGSAAAGATLSFSKSQNAEPDGRLELDPTGRFLYVVSGAGHCVRRIDLESGEISTFAGTGEPGYSGDGGQARLARLDEPSDVAVAADGTVFISDANNDAIRRVAPDGTISTYAGGAGAGYAGDEGPVAAARFDDPAGIEIDAHGNLYVADRRNHVVRVIASDAPGDLEVPIAPWRIALPERGAPPEPGASGTIDRFVGTGTLGFNGDGRPALDTDLYWPQDCAVDPYGLLVFCDWNNHRVRRVEADGTVTTLLGSGDVGDTEGHAANVKLNHPTDVAFHPLTGEMWIAGWHTGKVQRLDASTNELGAMAGRIRGFRADDEGKAPADVLLDLPVSVKFDAAGNWYVGDESNRRVRFVDAEANTLRTILGNGTATSAPDGTPGLESGLDLAIGQSAAPGGRVALSPDERWLYVAESSGARVRRIDLHDPQRPVSTFAGTGVAGTSGDGGPATAARLMSPVDVDCDAAGNVYVVDQDGHAVRRVDAATGTITTIAGDGTSGLGGDGGPASKARLRFPGGIYVDRASGRIFVADTYNGVIRVIWE